ncbi:MAG: hypothetical protein ABW007_23825, partial [Chitinophagaceae bacterium]
FLMKAFLSFFLVLSLLFFSCKKSFNDQNFNRSLNSYEAKTEFAKTLATSLKNEPFLRKFIKDEALKQFDKDYDVVYHLVKDHVFPDGLSFSEKVLKYAKDRTQLQASLKQFPLMTIYVPVLQNFNASTWNTDNEVPMVAVSPEKINKRRYVELFDHSGQTMNIGFADEPGFPTLVVKLNERLVIENEALSARSALLSPESDFPVFYTEKEGVRFAFLSKRFDGVSRSTQRYMPIQSVPQEWITAYNISSPTDWQRDYIYYGITSTTPNGAFRNNFREYINTFTFVNPAEYYTVADHANDPTAADQYFVTNSSSSPMWTQGNFEIRISILINAKNGTGQQLEKSFTATGPDLFNTTYSEKSYFGGIKIYTLTGISSKTFFCSIDLIPWNLEVYGNAWKFIVSEYDPAEEITSTIVNTTAYGTNFGLDDGFIKKLGGKFGLTTSSTTQTTYTYKTTAGSDALSEGILDFQDPVLEFVNPPVVRTREVSTGRVTMSVEPVKIF